MKIINLQVDNYKRLKAVDITPEGELVIIGGRNAQGKTSVLDSIWAALGGGAANKSNQPIRDGEDNATIRVDLGDIVVTRSWKNGKAQPLKVMNADGSKPQKSPQSLLDDLVGKLSFDPLEFTRMDANKQRAALLDLVYVDIDLDENEAERSKFYEQRTSIGQQTKALGERLPVSATLPANEQSASDLIAEIRTAQQAATDKAQAERTLDAHIATSEDLEIQIEELQKLLSASREAAQQQHELVKVMPAAPDVSAIEERLANVESTNIAIRANESAKARNAAIADSAKVYDELTAKIEGLDKQKATALGAAIFPVDGLGFGEYGVTFNGISFDDASSAEQIRVSFAMAIALNPTLRVARILDGSLLDADSMKILSDMATDKDFQVWIERVGDGDPTAVIIEDGEVSI